MTAWTSVGAVAGAGRVALPEAVIEKAATELDSAAKAAAEGTAQAGADPRQGSRPQRTAGDEAC